jgi:formyltetrahydrofolate deformylase
MSVAIALCTSADGPGIVAAVTGFVTEYRGNILDMDQHTDTEAGRFFMRCAWDMDGFALAPAEVPTALGLLAKKFVDMRFEVFFDAPRPRVALFASKEPHCLADLLLRHQMGELPGELALVIANHPDLKSWADHFAIPFFHVPSAGRDKAEMEAEQRRLLEDHAIDLVVLARYMQIVGPAFSRAWAGRMINIHHSFLPAFVGAKPYHQARARGVKIVGATAHYVTEDLDQGPIIEQSVVRVSHRDGTADLIRKGRDVEREVLGRAVRLHLERRVIVDGRRTVVFA